jgi:hypothetical protein
MTDYPDFTHLSYQVLFEIRKQLSWIKELLRMMFFFVALWAVRGEHVSLTIWIVSIVIIAGLLWFLDHKYG